jgi:hypothetical protein
LIESAFLPTLYAQSAGAGTNGGTNGGEQTHDGREGHEEPVGTSHGRPDSSTNPAEVK